MDVGQPSQAAALADILELHASHVLLDRSAFWQVQDLGPGTNMAGELLALPYWAEPTAGEHKNHGWGCGGYTRW